VLSALSLIKVPSVLVCQLVASLQNSERFIQRAHWNRARNLLQPPHLRNSYRIACTRTWKRMDMMRNLLVHRIVPGRTIRLSARRDLPDSIDLDQWFEGDVTRIYGRVGLPEPKWTFELDANCLVMQMDWIDKSIDGISERLTELAKDNGLG
jgi:hypothetical protein